MAEGKYPATKFSLENSNLLAVLLAMKLMAPISVSAPTGAEITTAEAAMTCKLIIGFLAVDLKEIHSDLPQLPDRM